MSLPPALLARLQKRGLVQENTEDKVKVERSNEEEEVFAESYDDPDTNNPPLPTPEPPISMTEDIEDEPDESFLIHEVIACPNKSNPYHECVDFCRLTWGMKEFDPDSTMLRRRTRMLKKYPLADNWKEVADPTTSRYYYWNTETDEVSWLAPSHPRAVVSLSIDKLQEMAKKSQIYLDEEGQEKQQSSDESNNDSSDSDSEDDRRRQKSRALHERSRERRGRNKDDDLDPMDPSSYSDIPRGTWSSGLDARGAAKTGVDHTVAGPLFQQRPYPSPGDVLRANRQIDDKPSDEK